MKDKTQIFEKYRHKPHQESFFKLKGGSIVIGEEVDDDNTLLYVIQNGNQITVEPANKHRPIEILRIPSPTIIVSKANDKKIPIPNS